MTGKSDEAEKLEAWRSLKAKGFKFKGWHFPSQGPAKIIIEGNCVPDSVEELDTLFGDKIPEVCDEDAERLLANLDTLSKNLRADPSMPDNYSDWLEHAIDYIKEVKCKDQKQQ